MCTMKAKRAASPRHINRTCAPSLINLKYFKPFPDETFLVLYVRMIFNRRFTSPFLFKGHHVQHFSYY